MHVFCDFDGTITVEDATDFILTRLADPAWETIEAEWKAGHIGSSECMRRQIALIHASREQLDGALDQIKIDPAFADFVRFCAANFITVSIISDGVDYFIERIMARIGLAHLPVIANHLVMHEDGRFELTAPYSAPTCTSAAGVCKCRIVAGGEEPRIYIGDGRSDFCVSSNPEIVFAKASLATYCAQNAIPYIGYEDFSDVTFSLQRLVAGAVQRTPAAAQTLS
jgi:2-hydroxy-3-keto-5-methylthiopentenyl-1-phosphate phosphatase